MSGYNGGLSVLGVGLRKPSKGGRLVSRYFSEGNFSGIVPPAWAKFALLEGLGQGGNATDTGGSPGGHGADRIIKVEQGMTFFAGVSGYGSSPTGWTSLGIDPSITLLYAINGDAASPSTYARYLGGTTTVAPKYGFVGDLEAASPASYYPSYGIGGGGRLAGKLLNVFRQNGSGLPFSQGAGGSRVKNTTYSTYQAGMGAACITFAETKQQLIDFLNYHYKDGWGVDWRDIPPTPDAGIPSPQYGAIWS